MAEPATDACLKGVLCDVAVPSAGARKKLKFMAPPLRLRPAQPRASDLSLCKLGDFAPYPLPSDLLQKLFPAPSWVLGFDIETNDWVERTASIKGSIGEHGYYNLCRPCDLESRIVQLSWVIHDGSGSRVVERIVQPRSWAVSVKAERYHGISQKQAEENGVPIEAALAEFLCDVRRVCSHGGRLVSHHIEFDVRISASMSAALLL